MRATLVLAGGGVRAIAWELGVLRGRADADAELAHKIIGADQLRFRWMASNPGQEPVGAPPRPFSGVIFSRR
jgi:hypothetical protein